MGSLPDLNDVHQEQLERREREKERELARERAREREFCHDRDSWRERVRLSIFSQQVAFVETSFWRANCEHIVDVIICSYVYVLLLSPNSLISMLFIHICGWLVGESMCQSQRLIHCYVRAKLHDDDEYIILRLGCW